MAKLRIEQDPTSGRFIVIDDDSGQRTTYVTRAEAETAVQVQSGAREGRPTDEKQADEDKSRRG